MKSVLSAAALLCLVTAAFAADAIVPYPAGYRDWYHVKSMVIQEGNSLFAAFGGIHHIYFSTLRGGG